MIISGLIRKQLIAFTIASIIGVLVLGTFFMRVPETLGIGRYTVSADFRDGAGLYEDAQVNYLGTPVGKVSSMELADSGITVELSIKDDVRIPADARAEIHSVSAVGEQYVELVPGGGSSVADLEAGDRITSDRTSEPVEIGPVLDNVANLVDSLPRKELASLLSETSAALSNRDQDLQSILDGSQAFLREADAAFPQTRDLIHDAEPLLSTLNASGSHIASLSNNLSKVTDELREGDADLRALLATGPAFAAETSGFLADIAPLLPGLLEPLATVTQVTATYDDFLRQLLSDYPIALSLVQSVTLPDRDISAVRLTVSQVNKPPECSKGFLPVSKWRLPADVGKVFTPLYYCDAPANDTRVVRGARNVPCPGQPGRRAPTPALCKENR